MVYVMPSLITKSLLFIYQLVFLAHPQTLHQHINLLISITEILELSLDLNQQQVPQYLVNKQKQLYVRL